MAVFDYGALCGTLERLYRSFGLLPRVLARTALGRAVFALDLGAASHRSLLLCGQSGDEGTLCALTLHFTESLLKAQHNATLFCGLEAQKALSDCGVSVVPCLNPDGLELNAHGLSAAGPLRRGLNPQLGSDVTWHANANGVDLRRQYPVGFSEARDFSAVCGITEPGPTGFPGGCPCSEAEPRALCQLCRREKPRHALLLQKGERALFYRAQESGDSQAALCAKLLAAEAQLPLREETDSNGSFAAWFAQTAERPAFTVQTGNGNAPLPEAALFSCLMLAVLL